MVPQATRSDALAKSLKYVLNIDQGGEHYFINLQERNDWDSIYYMAWLMSWKNINFN